MADDDKFLAEQLLNANADQIGRSVENDSLGSNHTTPDLRGWNQFLVGFLGWISLSAFLLNLLAIICTLQAHYIAKMTKLLILNVNFGPLFMSFIYTALLVETFIRLLDQNQSSSLGDVVTYLPTILNQFGLFCTVFGLLTLTIERIIVLKLAITSKTSSIMLWVSCYATSLSLTYIVTMFTDKQLKTERLTEAEAANLTADDGTYSPYNHWDLAITRTAARAIFSMLLTSLAMLCAAFCILYFFIKKQRKSVFNAADYHTISNDDREILKDAIGVYGMIEVLVFLQAIFLVLLIILYDKLAKSRSTASSALIIALCCFYSLLQPLAIPLSYRKIRVILSENLQMLTNLFNYPLKLCKGQNNTVSIIISRDSTPSTIAQHNFKPAELSRMEKSWKTKGLRGSDMIKEEPAVRRRSFGSFKQHRKRKFEKKKSLSELEL